ncbi:MAG: Ig-like domain-containing protein [Acidobacteriota bacterium]|jgi:hypothetical protein
MRRPIALHRKSSYLVLLTTAIATCCLGLAENPKVVSTNPPNGATGVSRTLGSYSITFNKTMRYACGALTSGWLTPGSTTSCTWSPDMRTVTMSRGAGDPLGAESTVTVWINPPSLLLYQDVEGNFADPYTLMFTTTGDDVQRIEAAPEKGFSWPYFLYVPLTVKTPTFLLVETNNTGTVSDDQAVHESSARSIIVQTAAKADELGSPMLVPTFPRPASHPEVYTHALDRNTLLTQLPGLERIDLQLLAMIDDARQRLAGLGLSTDPRIWIIGASASGQFDSRFVMLHPDRVKAASIGCPGYGPIVPVAEWNGVTLPYPEGISDLAQLVGKPFDVETFRTVPLQVWVGDKDTNIVPWYKPESDPEVALVAQAFGAVDEPEEYTRWPAYEAAYQSVTSMAQFVVFPDMAHQWADWDYIRTFLERNRVARPPAPLPKPRFYRLFFPHIACGEPWTTEVAMYQTKQGVAVEGDLEAHAADGALLESLPFEVPGGGRREIVVNDFFADPADIAYLVYHSDSGFINGYTRFYEPKNRVAIPAAAGSLHGWFPKKEFGGGWTGIALVNTEEEAAQVTLEARDDQGQTVETLNFTLQPGEKKVKLAHELFSSDLSIVTHFYFESDRRLAGFSINGSANGWMMDGMPTLVDRYIR